MLKQLAPAARALRVRQDTQPGQIPVLERRMRSIHLLEDREHVLVLLVSDSVREDSSDGRFVHSRSGREPHRDGVKVTERPNGQLIKCLAGERGDELAKPRLILLQIGKQPALDRIARKRRHDGRDRPRSTVVLHLGDRRGGHSRDPNLPERAAAALDDLWRGRIVGRVDSSRWLLLRRTRSSAPGRPRSDPDYRIVVAQATSSDAGKRSRRLTLSSDCGRPRNHAWRSRGSPGAVTNSTVRATSASAAPFRPRCQDVT